MAGRTGRRQRRRGRGRPLLKAIVALLLLAAGFSLTRGLPRHSFDLASMAPRSSGPLRMARPYGMAPAAFEAYIRACCRAGINPRRIGQTIGDYPLSFGYHKQDGVLIERGVRIPYTAAVDLAPFGPEDPRNGVFLRELERQGFACWYRHGGKWKGGEHIHAVYAFLPMKPQLRRQVELFLHERRAQGVRLLRWETRLQRRLKRHDA